jgi:hypothetical protein
MSDLMNIRSRQLSRRLAFRSLATLAGGAVILGTTMRANRAVADATKNAQKTAGYQATPQGAARCDNCKEFEAPSSCKTVEGSISPTGWCRIYIKMPA